MDPVATARGGILGQTQKSNHDESCYELLFFEQDGLSRQRKW
jgi:hypothetical protein